MVQRQLPGLVENSVSIERMARYLEDHWSKGAILRTVDHDVLVGLIEDYRLGSKGAAEEIVKLLSSSVPTEPIKADFEVSVVSSLLDEAYQIESSMLLLGGALALPTPLAVKWAEDKALELAKYLTDMQRETIKKLIVSALGKTPMNGRKLAPLILSCVDLTPIQSGWVLARYNRLIASGNTPEMAQLAVDAFAARLRRQRALTISITEINRALIGGRMFAWEDYESKGYLKNTMKRWLTAPDCCKLCLPLNGQTVGIKELFDTPWGMIENTANGHPRCRCNIVMESGFYDIMVGAGLKAGPLVIPGTIAGYVEPPMPAKALINAAISKALLSKEEEGHKFRGNQYTGGIKGALRVTPRSGLVGAQAAIGQDVPDANDWPVGVTDSSFKSLTAARKAGIASTIDAVLYTPKSSVLQKLSHYATQDFKVGGTDIKTRLGLIDKLERNQYVLETNPTTDNWENNSEAFDVAAPYVKFRNAALVAERMLAANPDSGNLAMQWLEEYARPPLVEYAKNLVNHTNSSPNGEPKSSNVDDVNLDRLRTLINGREATDYQMSSELYFHYTVQDFNDLSAAEGADPSGGKLGYLYKALGAETVEDQMAVALYIFASTTQGAWAESTNSVAAAITKKSVSSHTGHSTATEQSADALATERYNSPIYPGGDKPLSSLVDAYVEETYKITQEELAKAGLTSVPLYRGVVVRPDFPKYGNTTQSEKEERDAQAEAFTRSLSWTDSGTPPDLFYSKGYFVGAGKVKVEADSLSSWATEQGVAEDFSKFGDVNTQYGAILFADVPAKDIFAFAYTGLGSLTEHEAVVINSSDNIVSVSATSAPQFVPEDLKTAGVSKDDGFVFYLDFPGLYGADWIKQFKDSSLRKEEEGHAFRGNQYTGGIKGTPKLGAMRRALRRLSPGRDAPRSGVSGRSSIMTWATPGTNSKIERPYRVDMEDLVVAKPKESLEILKVHGFASIDEYLHRPTHFLGAYGLSHYDSARNAEKDMRPLLNALKREINDKFEEDRIIAFSEYSKIWNPDPKTRVLVGSTPYAQNVDGVEMGKTLLMDHAEVLITKTVEAMKPYYGSVTHNPVQVVGTVTRRGLRGSMSSSASDASQNTLNLNLLPEPEDNPEVSEAVKKIYGSMASLMKRKVYNFVGTDTNLDGFSQNLEAAAPIFFDSPFYDANLVFTLLHELGHNLDTVAYETGSNGYTTSIPAPDGREYEWPESFGYWQDSAKAKESVIHTSESPEVAALEGVLPEVTALLKAARGSKWFRQRSKDISDPELGMSVAGETDPKAKAKAQKEYRTYWRSPVEVFARVYAQWVATKLLSKDSESKEFMDSINMAGMLEGLAAEPGQGYLWPQEEFDTKIAPLLEDLLRKRGILK